MKIKGFINISLVDWDEKVTAVIFLPGCNLRCPYCYNSKLVLHSDRQPTIAFEEILSQLEENEDWIDGVVILGGEPTIHSDLKNLCLKIKKMSLLVKLDTNGTNPVVISELIEKNLIDYVALDVKAPLNKEKYSNVCGVNVDFYLNRIRESINILLKGKTDYEFRTTVVPLLHKKEDVEAICFEIMGCKKYVIQNFKSDVETIDQRFNKLKPFSKSEMEVFLNAAKRIIPYTTLR
jgi:pyruvate formate lyase activating enzyme